MPTSEWPLFLGKFLGLGLVLVLFLALLGAAGVLVQATLGYHEYELGLYLKVLLGLQLPEYLLFAMLALVVHVLLDQKYVAHMTMLVIYAFIAMPALFRVENQLLVYGSGPWWSYSDMRGFGASLGPWLHYRLYWGAWALFLAVVARLLWIRGRERAILTRLRLARARFTRATVLAAAAATGLVVTLGGFIDYDSNARQASVSEAEHTELLAEYERRYGMYDGVPQPGLESTRLHVDIRPDEHTVRIQGVYRLVNRSPASIDSIHVAIIPGATNGAMSFDRPAVPVLRDELRGHRIYELEEPLQPGDTLQLRFVVTADEYQNRGLDAPVVENGTFFTNAYWLPAIGYQPRRELTRARDRRKYGLPPQPMIASLLDREARMKPGERTALDAVIVTEEDQVAVAPGVLRRSWTEGGRRHFHYASDSPIANDYAFFSARYEVREAQWNDVAVRIFHHPDHTANLDRMMRGAVAALQFYTEEFGPYPYEYLTLVEVRGMEIGMHADPGLIRFTEGTALWKMADDPRSLDLPFDVVAHEVSHQWWGHQLEPARVEGAPVIAEGLAVYSAMSVVEETWGRDHLRRLLAQMRRPDPYPPIRRGDPLLRGLDPYLSYRRAPFALHALSEYTGRVEVRTAMRRLLEKHPAGEAPLATTLDLYRELQAVTPDSLRTFLHDLFEVNTSWNLSMERATATQTEDGMWQVTLNVRARKVVTDTAGVEQERPMTEWVEIGVFAPGQSGHGRLSAPLYIERHRIRSGRQTITVMVPGKPVLAGIDPYHVLDWEHREDDDNLDEVRVGR